MQRLLTFVLGLVLVVTLGGAPALAEKRVALVVGNDRYQNLSADQQLRKAVNDARAVGDALVRLGFEVIRGENLGRQALIDKLDELTARLSPGDTAFFFFAGHGVAIGGGNYILPVDVPLIEGGQETRLARAALSESDIVSDLQGRGVRVAVVVLDACRSNPFRRSGTRSVGGERGLTRIEPVRGVFSLYSAGIGQTALDRLGNADPDPNSVFTRVLIPALGKPGLHLGDLAIEVREEVARLAKTVGHQQRPAYYDETIGGKVYLAGLPPPGDPLPPPSPPGSDPHAAISNAAAAAIDSVVKVSSGRSISSGFILDPSGLVVVTDHTIIDATNVMVTLKDGTRLKAELVGRDQKTDLALLRVKTDRPLKAVKLGASGQLKVGERIIVIGHPQGLDSTVTDAMITGLNRTFGGSNNYIQINVAYKGMGPLFNLGGELIGISAAFMNPEPGSTVNFGFAIPSAMATVVTRRLLEEVEKPAVAAAREEIEIRSPSPLLGATVADLSPALARELQLNPLSEGVVIVSVRDGSPAKAVGFRRSDFVLNVNGQISTITDLERVLQQGARTWRVTIRRDGQSITATLNTDPSPVAGMQLAEMSADLRARYRIKETVKGVVITDVVKESAAAQRGLTAGTVIEEMGGQAVNTLADVSHHMDEARKQGRKIVVLRVSTPDDQAPFVALPIPEQTAKGPELSPFKDGGKSGSGWIGVRIQSVTQEIAGSLGLKKAEGAIVAEVTAGGPAARAGITQGDVVVSVEGTPVKDSSELSKMIAGMAPGTEVKVGIVRGRMEQTIAITLGALPGATDGGEAQVKNPNSPATRALPRAPEGVEALRRKAADNDASAMAALGDHYYQGDGIAQDYAEARRWYEKAANLGNPDAMNGLGILYFNGAGVAKDHAGARRWFEKAADLKNSHAMSNLGLLHASGNGVAKDYAQARRWYEKAAELKNASAMVQLGLLSANGFGVAKDAAEARRWFARAAEAGDASVMVQIGVLHAQGKGVTKDYAEARRWLERAAGLGDTSAMTNLGMLHANGFGVPKSYAEARRWLEKAANGANTGAMNNLGLLYAKGLGVPVNIAEAKRWYEKSAGLGDTWAMTELGTMYASGRGVPLDYTEAWRWFEKAAEKGSASAMYNIGLMYELGKGVAKSKSEARNWYQKSAAAGLPEAAGKLARTR